MSQKRVLFLLKFVNLGLLSQSFDLLNVRTNFIPILKEILRTNEAVGKSDHKSHEAIQE